MERTRAFSRAYVSTGACLSPSLCTHPFRMPFLHPPSRYTYLVQHGLKDGNKHTQAIGGVSFFTLYLLKVLKRDYFPPTPARKKQPLYLLFSYLVFSTIIVVVVSAYWARALHYAGRCVCKHASFSFLLFAHGPAILA